MEYAVLWFLCGLIAAAVGSSKNLGAPGFLLGLLLGPIGIMIVVLSSGNRIPCPFCREKMNRRAIVCPHCQCDVVARAVPAASSYLLNILMLLIVGAIIGLAAALWLHPAWLKAQ